ncbi:MAG: nucleoside kinase [Bacteroidales bacterium]|jgi:uridine kinase|nr:nucleoside kinase [Bacteroidales bacterium]
MEEIRIYCENTSAYVDVAFGAALNEIAPEGSIAALVDNKLKSLEYRIISPHNVRFVDYGHPDGRRTYVRSLSFVLQNVVREMFPDKVLSIDYSLPSGLYCEIRENTSQEDGRPKVYFVTDEEIAAIKVRMREIVEADLPFTKKMLSLEETVKVYTGNRQKEKANLAKTLGRFNYSVYYLDGQADTFYGPLAPSTRFLKTFDLMGYNDGFCLQYPMDGSPDKVLSMKRQSKLANALKEHSDWCHIQGVGGVGALNERVLNGKIIELINLSEAFQEKKFADIAKQIYDRRGSVKIVFIAGPSSSGKTSSSKRLALQCRNLGLNPKVIELDNYFVEREQTPRDENGEYDFECLGAMDLKLLGEQLNALLEGKEVEIPRFDFKEGRKLFEGKMMHLQDKDILIMEGIHALNPAMIPDVDSSKVFRVYVSALTSLSLDENNNISTSDNRMLRRMIRDNRTRGIIPEETITRWASVRRGENRNIFPFQENADAVLNSAHIFELPILKYYAEPLLRRIAPSSPAFVEAARMLKFLDSITALSPAEIAAVPPTSILREFIDGQTL